METKVCTKCGEEKPTSDYYFKKCSGSYEGACKRCRNKQVVHSRKYPKVIVPPPDGLKKCCTCKEVKPVSEFTKNRSKTSGLSDVCKTCWKAYTKKWAHKHRDKRYATMAKYKYGVDVVSLFTQQSGRCGICGTELDMSAKSTTKNKANVDHCHTSDRVRGLLCFHCNTGLGHFRDDLGMLVRAVEYLTPHEIFK